jgi:hypothetical protein
MKRRVRRINFRLTVEEEERLLPLMKALHLWGWSELCRTALKRLEAAEQIRTTDKIVIRPIGCQTPPAVSDKKDRKGKGRKASTGRKSLVK